jgi:uncharacterized protein
VSEERFEVKLTFDGIPERLSVPFSAIKVFFDPSVPYGLQFEPAGVVGEDGEDAGTETDHLGPRTVPLPAPAGKSGPRAALAADRVEKRPRSPRKVRTDKPEEKVGAKAGDGPSGASEPKQPGAETPPAANDTKVVSLDQFRKK